jgi:hypothetical protein
MSQGLSTEIAQIIRQALVILADGVPRKSRELALILQQCGLAVDRRSVNQALTTTASRKFSTTWKHSLIGWRFLPQL